jgi:hypothetical protein
MFIKKIIKPINSIIIGLSILSCGNSQTLSGDYSSVETITIDTEDHRFVSLDNIVEKVDFVRLETTEDCIIGDISHLFFVDNKIIVADQLTSQSIFVFDINGKFLNRVSHLGNGPHEYLDITDVDVTPSGLIVIKDNVKDKLLFFEPNGKFVKERIDIEGGMDLAFIDEHSIAFDTFTSHAPTKEKFKGASLAVCDGDNNIQYLFGENIAEENVFNVRRPECLYRYGNKAYFAPHWDKNIYEVTTDSIIAKYRLEFLPDDVLNYKFKTSDELNTLMKDYPFFNGSFIEMQDYTWLRYMSQEEISPSILYSHKDKKTYSIYYEFNNPLYIYLQKPMALYKGNTIAEVVPALYLYINKNAIEETLGETDFTKNLFRDFKLDDNPIVFLFTFKNDISKYVIK